MGENSIISQLIASNQEVVRISSATATAVGDLAARLDRMERRLFGESGELDKNIMDVQELKNRLSWAKGYVAGWIAAIALAGSAGTLLIQWALKKFGVHI